MKIFQKITGRTNRNFLKLLFKLALPIILQNFLQSSMALIDILMIGQLNDAAVAAVGIANQFVFIFIIIQFGIHSGISIFTAQYWGKQNHANIRKLVGIGIVAGLLFSVFFTYVALIRPEALLAVFSKDREVVRLGAGYLRIVGISFFMTALTFSFMNNLRSINIVTIPMYAGGIAVIFNVILNYIFIFGKLGMPAMGVAGAALATCLARFLEGFLLMGIVYLKNLPIAVKLSDMRGLTWPFVRKVLSVCWPVFLNEFFWVIGVSLYNLVYARIGTESIAAVNIVASIENFLLIPFFGMFHAGSIMVANSIGSGREDDSYQYGRSLISMQFFMAIVTGGVMILSRDVVLSFYNISEVARTNAYHLMFVAGVVLCIKTTNVAHIVSVLRGGGDTRFGFLLDITSVWCIGVPMAFFGAFYLKLPVYWVMALVATEELFKLVPAIRRFRSRKWIRNLVR